MKDIFFDIFYSYETVDRRGRQASSSADVELDNAKIVYNDPSVFSKF